MKGLFALLGKIITLLGAPTVFLVFFLTLVSYITNPDASELYWFASVWDSATPTLLLVILFALFPITILFLKALMTLFQNIRYHRRDDSIFVFITLMTLFLTGLTIWFTIRFVQ